MNYIRVFQIDHKVAFWTKIYFKDEFEPVGSVRWKEIIVGHVNYGPVNLMQEKFL